MLNGGSANARSTEPAGRARRPSTQSPWISRSAIGSVIAWGLMGSSVRSRGAGRSILPYGRGSSLAAATRSKPHKTSARVNGGFVRRPGPFPATPRIWVRSAHWPDGRIGSGRPDRGPVSPSRAIEAAHNLRGSERWLCSAHRPRPAEPRNWVRSAHRPGPGIGFGRRRRRPIGFGRSLRPAGLGSVGAIGFGRRRPALGTVPCSATCQRPFFIIGLRGPAVLRHHETMDQVRDVA